MAQSSKYIFYKFKNVNYTSVFINYSVTFSKQIIVVHYPSKRNVVVLFLDFHLKRNVLHLGQHHYGLNGYQAA